MKEPASHQIASIFPLMGEEDLAQLAADIKANGLKEPILLYQDQILDGRNRWKACQMAGVEPRTKVYEGQEPATLVLSLNLHRRHLAPSQKAAVAVEVLPWFEREAKKRRAHGATGPGKTLPAKLQEASSGEAAAHAASALGLSPRYVYECKAIQQKAPELYEQIKTGQKTIPQAKLEIKKAEHARDLQARATQPPPTRPPGPFDLILADPPWRYDFSQAACRDIENHYPTASLEEICAHKPNVQEDAVLLLWATSPKLPEALEVLKAWGFRYVSSAVWHKKRPGMGYWFRGQHELLLVGVRGQFSPPIPSERIGSVFEAPRRAHSAKPECVYTWIERAFPQAQKLEMYSRTPRPGWAVFGNEVENHPAGENRGNGGEQ